MLGFGNKATKLQTAISGVDSVISYGTSTGTLRFNGTISIAGNVNGDLTGSAVKGNSAVEVTASGAITGDVTADSVIISGYVSGNIKAKSVLINDTAVVNGTISYEVIQINSGAKVNSKLECNAADTTKPAVPQLEAATT